MADYPKVGDRYELLVPVEIDEDTTWGIGKIVEVTHVLDESNGFEGLAGVELADEDGFASQFSKDDIDGEFGWFKRVE